MKKKLQRNIKLQLSRETLTHLDHVVGAQRTVDFSACVTNCPACGQTNYISCLC